MKRLSELLLGYRRTERRFRDQTTVAVERVFNDRRLSGIDVRCAKWLMHNPLTRGITRLFRLFAFSSTRAYGYFLLFFGLVTLLLNLASHYFFLSTRNLAVDLSVGAILALVAIPLLFFDRPMCLALQEWAPSERLLFDILCIKRIHPSPSDRAIPHVLAGLLGCIPAIVGFFLPIGYVILALLLLLLVAISLTSPEFPFLLTLLVLPFFPCLPYPTLALTCAIGLAVLSLLLKVLLGKRVLHFEEYDALLLLLGLFLLLSGCLGGGNSLALSLFGAVTLCGYLLAGNLIINRRLAECAIHLLLVSSLPTALYGLLAYFLSGTTNDLIASFLLPGAETGASTFGTREAYAVYLLAVMLLSSLFLAERRTLAGRLLYTGILVLNALMLGLVAIPAAWLALLLSLLALAILRGKHLPKELLFPLLFTPLLLLLIPGQALYQLCARLGLDTAIADRLSQYRASLAVLWEHPLLGTGLGDGCYEQACYEATGVAGGSAANLLLAIGCQLGIPALCLFLLLILVRVRHISIYSLYVRTSSHAPLCTVCQITVLALLLLGVGEPLSLSPLSSYLFFSVFGMGSAMLRVSKQERDERLDYYNQLMESDAAATDVAILDR